jgi:endonuclease/exonuclease/phosphatase family metal-dependent hydrolase
MPRSLSLVCLVSSWVVLGTGIVADDRRPDRNRLSLATFNANFLFDGRQPEGNAAFPWKGNPARAREHLERVADVLREVSADILHISEVEDLPTLERLRVALGDPTYRAYLVEGRDDFTRQNVGFLTRVDPVGPLLTTDRFLSAPRRGVRQGVSKHYLATFDLGSFSLALIGAHLLAFPDDVERGVRRELQAEILRQLAIEHGTAARRLVCILGDLNDFDAGVLDAGANRPLTNVLETLRSVDPASPDDDLINVGHWLLQPERFTAYYDRDGDGVDDGRSERSLTDHILVPSRLARAVAGVDVVATYPPGEPSDHFPLQVTLNLARLDLFHRGDANGDGKVGLADAVAVLEALLGAPLTCPDAADVDDSGRIDLADALCLSNALFFHGEAPPYPGPRLPGIDPTADELTCRRPNPH